ncbi:hypothetical protein Cgig2_012561 [Carnegiea gigantea]|uniref:Uncharacterized protein n=1 Tax=Carnegiea gigantea TaxID=171969 RepID=A0A9Q1K273_9CARY|nr:hypothetical protein Cgig2_012561 [Carnegiea gigantea]
MAGPSRRTPTTQTSGGWESSQSDFDNSAKYYCNCGYEVVIYEMDDNYRCRYLVRPLEVEFINPLASDASSPLQGPHVGPRSKVICGTVVPIACECVSVGNGCANCVCMWSCAYCKNAVMYEDVCQILVLQGSNIAMVEAHRAASQCEKVHEDHHKYAAFMATAKLLSLSEC